MSTGVIQGARVAEAILVSLLLIGGAGIAAGQSDSFGPGVGWAFLAIAATVLIFEMEHWVKILPGILALGVYTSLRSLSTGHLVNQPQVSVAPVVAITATLLFAAMGVLSLTFSQRKLNWVDRVALMAFVGFFLWGYVSTSNSAALLRASIALLCLIAAWGSSHLAARRA